MLYLYSILTPLIRYIILSIIVSQTTLYYGIYYQNSQHNKNGILCAISKFRNLDDFQFIRTTTLLSDFDTDDVSEVKVNKEPTKVKIPSKSTTVLVTTKLSNVKINSLSGVTVKISPTRSFSTTKATNKKLASSVSTKNIASGTSPRTNQKSSTVKPTTSSGLSKPKAITTKIITAPSTIRRSTQAPTIPSNMKSKTSVTTVKPPKMTSKLSSKTALTTKKLLKTTGKTKPPTTLITPTRSSKRIVLDTKKTNSLTTTTKKNKVEAKKTTKQVNINTEPKSKETVVLVTTESIQEEAVTDQETTENPIQIENSQTVLTPASAENNNIPFPETSASQMIEDITPSIPFFRGRFKLPTVNPNFMSTNPQQNQDDFEETQETNIPTLVTQQTAIASDLDDSQEQNLFTATQQEIGLQDQLETKESIKNRESNRPLFQAHAHDEDASSDSTIISNHDRFLNQRLIKNRVFKTKKLILNIDDLKSLINQASNEEK